MTEYGFHVTHISNVSDIKETGIHASTEGDWRQERKQLREKVDNYAHNNFSNWVDRKQAVYFWTTVDDAIEFMLNNFEGKEYVIISVDLSGYEVWAAESSFMEDLYHDWMNNGSIEYDLAKLAHHTERWDGTQKEGYEIWCHGPIPADDITEIQ